MTIYLCNAPKSVGTSTPTFACVMEMRQKKQSNQNRKIIYLEILKRRLEAKTNDHGLRVFSCEILPGGVVLMGARLQTLQSFDQKKPYKLWRQSSSFHGRLSFWKRKFNQTLITTQSLHHQTHTPTQQPHHPHLLCHLNPTTDHHGRTFNSTQTPTQQLSNHIHQSHQIPPDQGFQPTTFFSNRIFNPTQTPTQQPSNHIHPPHQIPPHHIFQPTTFQPNFAQLPAGVWIETTTRTTWYDKLCSKVLGNQTQQHFTNKPSTTVFLNTTFLISLLPLCNSVSLQAN